MLPYELVKLYETDFGPKKLPVCNPVEVYRAQQSETDTAFILHVFNSDIFNNDPAVFSLNNVTFPETVDHDPVYVNLNCFKLYRDEITDSLTMFGGGYRNDSAFVLKSIPTSNEFEFLYLASGVDLTGDDQWRGVVTFGNPIDYDFDGRVEFFCYLDPGRDLTPRLLCCVEPSTMTLEWSLPAASAVTLHQLFPCGDSTRPELIFATYNYRNGVEDANFSDLYCYLARVDSRGQVLDRRILSEEHGSKGLWRSPDDDIFYLFHALPLVKPDSMTDGQPHHYQLSKIDRDFRIIKSLDMERRVRQTWLADYGEDGSLDLYVLFYGGEVHIYDTDLDLIARSDETDLVNFVDTLRIGEDLQKAYVYNTAHGTVLYTHDFERLGQFDAPVWICYPLKYGPAGQVQQFIISHENAYRILEVSRRSTWTLARNIFYYYQLYILSILLILLLLVIWSNLRRLRAQRQLLETRRRLRSVIENVHDVVYRTDLEGRLVWVTPSGARLLGYDSVESMIGRPLKDLYVRASDRDRFLAELQKHGSVSDYEVMLRCRDGSSITVSTSSGYWRDADGNIRGVEGVVRDITARKGAEKALKEGEEKYRHLFDRAQVGMFKTTLDGSAFLAVNQRFADVYGGTMEELMTLPSFARWADPGARDALIEKLKADGVVTDYEIVVLNKQGEERNLLVSVQLYPEENCLEGTAIDITERKRTREALKESERRYYTVTESSPDGIMATDSHSMKIVFVNPAMGSLSGYSSEELLCMQMDELAEESQREKASRDFRDLVRGRTNTITNAHLMRKDRSIITVDIRVAQARLDGRTVILCFVRDVTDFRQQELLLRQRTASLKRLSNRLIDLQENDRKFIARELHDTVAQNLALSKIKLETAILSCCGADNGIVKEASGQVTEAIKQLKHIAAELRPQMLDELGLSPTIEWYLKNYSEGIKVDFETRGEPYGLESKKQINLFRVFQELMLNMKKHSGADRINVVLEYDPQHVTLTVEDNGRGFDLDDVTNKWSSSSTFGLMNITERVEIVGGEFTINAKEGRGATFVITIPGK